MRVHERKRSRGPDPPKNKASLVAAPASEMPLITVFDYSDAECTEWTAASADQCVPPPEDVGIRWINVDGVRNRTIIEQVGNNFGLHPLTIEDISHTEQLPKVEVLTDHAFIVIRMFRLDENHEFIVSEQVNIVFGPKFVLSFQEVIGDIFDPIRRRIRESGSRMRKSGSDYLVYSLVDMIVDHYFVTLDIISEQIEDAQEELMANPSMDTLRDIYDIKRRVIELRRYIWPGREVALKLEREAAPFFKKTTLPYLRDLYDHIIQTTDYIEIYREWLSSMLDIYLSSMSNKLNEIMKVLTAISTVFIPLTLVASIYGMNFVYMPGLQDPIAFPLLMGGMLALGGGMMLYFHRRGWI